MTQPRPDLGKLSIPSTEEESCHLFQTRSVTGQEAVCLVHERPSKPGAGAERLPRGHRAEASEAGIRARRVGLERGPLRPWLVHDLRALGLPGACLCARHARPALSMQVSKDEANKAEGLAQIVRTGGSSRSR
jgi:transposase